MTNKDLQRLTVVVRRGDKQQKLQVEKLTSDFRDIVERYSTSQQVCYLLKFVSHREIKQICFLWFLAYC